MSNYDDFYEKGGFKYKEDWGMQFIEQQTRIPIICQTQELSLLDLCCGDGFWSKVLNLYCKNITGVDITEKGLEIARSKLPSGTFIFQSALEYNQKHDIVFCRAAGIFNCFVDTDKFKANLEHSIGLAKKYFYYIEYSKPELYNVFNGSWYHKDPNDVYKALQPYGKVLDFTKDNYISFEVQILK